MTKRIIDAEKLREEIVRIQMEAFMCDDDDVVSKMNAMLMLLDRQPTVESPKWIKVEDGLPEELTDVLVWHEYYRYGEFNCMYQTFGISNYFKGQWMGDVTGREARCIAWMPLPTYEESEE